METLLQDIRYGLRSLLKHPGFTAIAVITLALGVGANTTIFSVVNATLMRPLPVSNPDNLIYLFSGSVGGVFSYPDYAELRDQNQVLDGPIAWGGISVSLNAGDQPDLVSGAIVTGNYFEVLGINAVLGRPISREDDRTPGAHPVAMISHALWQSRFGGDQNIVGKQLLLNGHSFTIIGVTPAGFNGAQPGIVRDIFVPMMMQATMRPPRAGYSGEMNPDLLQVRRNRWLYSVGRLKPGVSMQQAQVALAAIARQQEEANPDSNKGRSNLLVSSFRETDDPAERRQLASVAVLLMSVVALVLLIACANVANLLLARGSARTKEIAVRLAVGATRWRIVRQLLTESILLAGMGGALGLLIAWWASASLRAMPSPAGALPIMPNSAIDLRVLGFTLLLSLLAGVVFGLAPALRVSHPTLTPALKEGAWSPTDRRSFFNLRNLLVVTQVALSVMLLIAAGLFLRSLRHAQAINPGFDAERVVTVPLNINLLRYTKPQGKSFYRDAVERVSALPGVESVSLARIVALSGSSSVRSLLIQGKGGSEEEFRSEGGSAGAPDTNSVAANVIGLNYFRTMGVGLVRGRDFSSQDHEEGQRVAIVNESFVQRQLPGEEALGQRLSFNGPKGPWAEIVGVVRDSKYRSLGEVPTPTAYLPLEQNHETGMTLHVRTVGHPAVGPMISRELQAIEKNLPVSNPTPINELITNSLYAARMGAMLLAIFGLLALLLASIGLYGVMSFAVARRTRELGIRMALGARATDVFQLVVRQAMTMVVFGLVVGLAVAAMVTRLLTSFLYGVKTTDPITFAVIPIVLGAVAFAACYLPARRATKVDPLVALRNE